MKKLLFVFYKVIRKVHVALRMRAWPVVGPWGRKIDGQFFQAVKPTVAVTRFGHTMHLDQRDSLKLSLFGVYEPFETKLVMDHVKPGDVVFDLGANIGYYTLLFSRAVGDKGKVFAFEPDPSNFALLKKNVEANACGNCVLFQKAVSDREGILRLFVDKDNLADHRIYDSGDGRASVDVATVTGDAVMREYGVRPSFVKIDIQGAEALAVAGMKALLADGKPLTMVVEFWPKGLRQAGADPLALVRSLSDYGFRMSAIDEAGKVLRPIEDMSDEMKIGKNILCIR
jgi:FkbM family methyltransferase